MINTASAYLWLKIAFLNLNKSPKNIFNDIKLILLNRYELRAHHIKKLDHISLKTHLNQA